MEWSACRNDLQLAGASLLLMLLVVKTAFVFFDIKAVYIEHR